jgi:hypothetical protein
MSDAELDALVKEFGIETPKEWKTWDADAKRAWLKQTFEDDAAPAAEIMDGMGNPLEGGPMPEEDPLAGLPIVTVAELESGAMLAEALATETKPAKKSKSKAVAKSDVKTGEILQQGEDVLSDLIHEIETMKEKDAKELVHTLREQTEVTFFKLGGVLSVIQANGWFEPYASFREYVEKEHGIEYRRAVYWTAIYNALAESKVPWQKVQVIPWTKLKEIAKILTIENVDMWVEIAKKQNTITLIQTVKEHLAKDAPQAIEDGQSKTVTAKTFKVHEDQKATIEAAVSKAKEQGSDAVRLRGPGVHLLRLPRQPDDPQKLKSIIEAALSALEKAFPNAKIEVEIEEIEEISKVAGP